MPTAPRGRTSSAILRRRWERRRFVNVKDIASGGDISGFSAQDRMVMGLLRAAADAVVVSARVRSPSNPQSPLDGRRHFPGFAEEYRALRARSGKRGPPVNAVVSGSGRLGTAPAPVSRPARCRR